MRRKIESRCDDFFCPSLDHLRDEAHFEALGGLDVTALRYTNAMIRLVGEKMTEEVISE